jgi:hypothetical protein
MNPARCNMRPLLRVLLDAQALIISLIEPLHAKCRWATVVEPSPATTIRVIFAAFLRGGCGFTRANRRLPTAINNVLVCVGARAPLPHRRG